MANPTRPKLAGVVTTYFKYSHAQHVIDRFLDGYGWNGTYHRPAMDLVSLYVDQVGNTDLSRERAKRHPSLRLAPTIADALTLGGSRLAVDGVVIIGEHGNYPRNEKGQTRFPRYEFFTQVVKVFQDSGRSVPVFSDKHLSWNWDWAKEMYDTARKMGFPFMAGSSVPVTWRVPQLEIPLGARISEAMCISNGAVDSYDFHSLEAVQCMVERRRGGETGVEWIQAYRGEKFWEALRDGVWSKALMDAALCRSQTLKPARAGFTNVFPTVDDMRRLVRNPVAYRYQHSDGLTCTIMLLNGLLEDYNFAAFVNGGREPVSTEMCCPVPTRTTLANSFSALVNNIEKMVLTGKETYPVERTLLTTGLTAGGVESLYRQQVRFDTPHLAIRYQAARESAFERT